MRTRKHARFARRRPRWQPDPALYGAYVLGVLALLACGVAVLAWW